MEIEGTLSDSVNNGKLLNGDDTQNTLQNGDHETDQRQNGLDANAENDDDIKLIKLDIPNLNGDDDEAKKKLKKLIIDLDDGKADSGFKDLRNISKFAKAAEMMGTRKGNIFYLIFIVSSGQSKFLSLPTEAFSKLCLNVYKTIKVLI